jgi:hypothetical protein
MTTKECNIIRQQIDEADRTEGLTSAAEKHLHACDACRDFAADHTSLQQLLGDLGTVPAPADFDFRLKARLAREKDGARNSIGFASLLSGRRLATTAALILTVAAVVFSIRYVLPMFHSKESTTVVSAPSVTAPQTPPINNVATPRVEISTNPPNIPANHSAASQRNQVVIYPATKRKPGVVSRDMALNSAAVIEHDQDSLRGVMRVPLDDQALRISLDDGRGAQRMVSLPIVSFGSQRLMNSHSFAPGTNSPKGDW